MTYPQTPGHQAHSETSKTAAESIDASNLQGRVLEKLDMVAGYGLTCDDISLQLCVEQGTIAARIRELELAGKVIKTRGKRQTRHRRDAFIYVLAKHHREDHGRAAVKQEKPCDIIRLEAEHTRMKDHLDRILRTAMCERISDDDFRKAAINHCNVGLYGKI